MYQQRELFCKPSDMKLKELNLLDPRLDSTDVFLTFKSVLSLDEILECEHSN